MQRYPWSFHTDQRGLFLNADLEWYFIEEDIMHQQTAAYYHEYNGVVEYYKQTLSAMVRPAHEHAPPSLGAEA